MKLPHLELPRMFLVRQEFPRPKVQDLAAAVTRELEVLFPPGAIRKGAEVGITVGSRGIASIAEITRTAVEFLAARGASPFIIPAMGSHGGARAESQRNLIAHYGITEQSMGAPIRDSMETRIVGRTPEGVQVYLAESAWQSAGVLVVNRVKPHTDFKGAIESGLTKMCAIGLGKLEGARECHSFMFRIGLGAAIESAAEHILATGKILGGIGILENAYHETARVHAVPVDGFLAREEELLEESRSLMGRLPLQELEVLICQRIGKNLSGTGLDTNVIGRSVHGYLDGVPWQPGMPSIFRIVALDVSEESEGNAVGMGLVDFVPERFWEKVDFEVTLLNALTACAPLNARRPAVLRSDREAISAALATAPRRKGGARVACIRDTMSLQLVYLSESCLRGIEGRDDLEILTDPEVPRFDAQGNLLLPF